MRSCSLAALTGAVVIIAICVVAGGVVGGFVSSGVPVAVTALLGAVIGFLIGATVAWFMLGAVLGSRARETPTAFDEPAEAAPTADEPAGRT